MPTWYAVARNEYRLMTSSLRRIRKAVPVLLVLLPSLLFLVVLYYANQVHLQSYLEATLREYLRAVYGYVTEFEFAFGEVDITLLMCQFMGIMGFMLPVIAAVGSVFRETEVISNDMILASPLKPRDLLLGRFVANLFFLPVILVFFSFLLFPAIINHGLSSVASVLIIVSVASLPTLLGIWVGVLLSAYIQTKSEFSPRIRDIGKTILGVFGIIFGLSYFLLFSSQTSSLYWTYLPTTWVTNIIYFAIAGTNLAKVAYNFGIFSFYYYVPLQPDPLVSLVLLLGFVALVFFIGAKLSSRIYRFEVPVSKVTTIEKENWFFRTIKSTIPPPLGALTAVQLKEFSRSLDTVARVSTVLFFPLVIYFLNAMGISNSYMPSSDVFGVFFLPGFAFFYILMAAAMIGLIEASQMTVKQKDLFWTSRPTHKLGNRGALPPRTRIRELGTANTNTCAALHDDNKLGDSAGSVLRTPRVQGAEQGPPRKLPNIRRHSLHHRGANAPFRRFPLDPQHNSHPTDPQHAAKPTTPVVNLDCSDPTVLNNHRPAQRKPPHLNHRGSRLRSVGSSSRHSLDTHRHIKTRKIRVSAESRNPH
ncbi:MAG: ABC transporter permease [Candidatus Freyarchaeota archaeon]